MPTDIWITPQYDCISEQEELTLFHTKGFSGVVFVKPTNGGKILLTKKKKYNTVVSRAPTKNQVKQLNFAKHFNNLSESRYFSVWGFYFQVKIYLLNWICMSLPWIIPSAIEHMQISEINLEFQFSLFSTTDQILYIKTTMEPTAFWSKHHLT